MGNICGTCTQKERISILYRHIAHILEHWEYMTTRESFLNLVGYALEYLLPAHIGYQHEYIDLPPNDQMCEQIMRRMREVLQKIEITYHWPDDYVHDEKNEVHNIPYIIYKIHQLLHMPWTDFLLLENFAYIAILVVGCLHPPYVNHDLHAMMTHLEKCGACVSLCYHIKACACCVVRPYDDKPQETRLYFLRKYTS